MRISDWSSDVCSSDLGGSLLQTGVREIAKVLKGEFRMTCNQNLVIANVAARDRGEIDKLVEKYGLDGYKQQSGDRKSVVEGKSVSVRVDLGGRRIIKKKKNKANTKRKKENTKK